ncbi:hypothetical protein FQA39_LY12799 [Lamprigera yunnana]|nr:hypothetical protein FQA39_LY12799 [Lamprigera yunnana]
MAKFVKKGSLIAVQGRISVRSNQVDGKYETIVNVTADRVQFLESKSSGSDNTQTNNYSQENVNVNNTSNEAKQDRNGQILPRRVTGTSPKDQRQLALAIKRAREMALLPYLGNADRFKTFAKLVASEGVTRYMQGSLQIVFEDNQKYFTEFGNYMSTNNKDGAICLGAYMEGPFISPEKRGAHQVDLLIKPDIKVLDDLVKRSNNSIKAVVYAAERQDGSFTKYLIDNNIIPAVGHTDMTAEEFLKDYKLGAKRVTHLFNGMSGVDHRRPGLATAAFEYQDVMAEVISDGIHLHPDILRMIYESKDINHICIITDAMNAKGLPDGDYKLGNLDVIKTGMKVVLKDGGALAAAGSTYDNNVRTFLQATNMPMTDLIKMTSINVSKELGMDDQFGSIEVGKLADLVIMDKDLNVVQPLLK